MENRVAQHHSRTLAIAPSTRGFGFAVIEGDDRLVDWGVKSVKGDKNKECLAKAKELLIHYQPAVLVLEVTTSRRAARIKALNAHIVKAAIRFKIKVRLLPRERVYRAFALGDKGTKHALAEVLAAQHPKELGDRLPPKRRPWMSEDYRMGIFDAVGLGLAPWLLKQDRANKTSGGDSEAVEDK